MQGALVYLGLCIVYTVQDQRAVAWVSTRERGVGVKGWKGRGISRGNGETVIVYVALLIGSII